METDPATIKPAHESDADKLSDEPVVDDDDDDDDNATVMNQVKARVNEVEYGALYQPGVTSDSPRRYLRAVSRFLL